MKRMRAVCIACAWLVAMASVASAQTAPLTILVAGSPVASSRPAERNAGEWFIPLAAVARALDIDVKATADGTGIRARGRAGVEMVFDGRSGEIRYGQMVVGRVKAYRQIVLAGSIENLLFPVSGVVALLGVDVTEDPERQILRVEPAAGLRGGPSPPSFTLAGLDYSIGMTTGEGRLQHYTSLQGEALAGGATLSTQWLLNGNGSRVGIRQGSGQADFGERRILGAGDQTSRTSLDSLLTSYRGVSFRRPTGAGFDTEVYAGRAMGSVAVSQGELGLASYEGHVAGISTSRRSSAGEVALSGQWFDGVERRGVSAGMVLVRVTPRHQLKAQMVFGDFSGLSARTTPVRGSAGGASVLYTFTPVNQLSLTVQADRYGKNFLTAREDAQFNAQSSRRGTLTVRPFSGASIFAGLNDRVLLVGSADRLTGRHFGASTRVPGTPLQLGFFSSRQHDTASPVGRIDMTQYSATLFDAARFSGNAYYSETTFGGQAARNVGATIGREFSRAGRFSLLGQWQMAGSQRLGFEWQRELPSIGGLIRAAVERVDFKEPGRDARYVPQGTLALALPFGQRLHLSYSGNPGNRTLSIALSGPLARGSHIRHDGDRVSIDAVATVAGRVYFDADGSGTFQAGLDRGLPEVRIWLDDHESVLTDRDGSFHFDQVAPGARSLRAELDGVPADLVFGTNAERTVAAVPYAPNRQDFRVVRTGSVRARIAVMLPGAEEGQTVMKPLPDIRVVAVLPVAGQTPGNTAAARTVADAPHDSYTDVFGKVTLTALPPGTYELQIDAESIPEGFVASPGTARVVVRPGETTSDVQFVVAPAPKEVIRKEPGKGGGGIGGAGGGAGGAATAGGGSAGVGSR